MNNMGSANNPKALQPFEAEQSRDAFAETTPSTSLDPSPALAESRINKSFLNFAASSLLTVLTMLIGFISTPLLLKWLGTERYGALRAMTGWFSYLMFLEFGLSGVVSVRFAKALGERSSDNLLRVAAQGMLNARRTAVWMICVGLVLGVISPWLVPVSPAIRGELRASAFISLASALLFPLALFRWLVEADQRGYLVIWLLGVQSILVTSLSLLFAWLGWGMPGQSVATVLSLVPLPVFLAVYSFRRHSGLFSAVRHPADCEETRKDFRHLGFAAFMLGFCERIGLLTDEVVIARLLNPTSVSPFAVTQRLVSLAQIQLQSVSAASWAGMSQLHATLQKNIFIERLVELSQLVMILGLCAAVPITLYNHWFVKLWVGESLYGGDLLTGVSLMNAILISLVAVWIWTLAGTGHMHELLPVQICATALNLLISIGGTYVLTRTHVQFALVGPPAGTLLAIVLVQIWWLPILLNRHFGVPPARLLKAILMPFLPAIPLVLIGHYVAYHPANAPRWASLIGQMACIAMVYMTCVWWLILSKTERQTWLSRINGAVGRFKARF